MQKSPIHIFLSGGGTGGHLFPALAVAKAIEAEARKSGSPGVRVFFVGAKQGIEARVIPKTDFPIFFIPSDKFNFSGQPLKKIWTILKVFSGLIKALYLVGRYRPQYALGFGGYASFPFMLAAIILKWRGTRVGLWEPNAKMGLANKVIAQLVDDCFLVFPERDPKIQKKSFLFGLPLRPEVVSAALEIQKQVPKDSLPKTAGQSRKLKIFIFGGSQGARGINQAILGLANSDVEYFKNHLEVYHQTGTADFESVKNEYQNLGISVRVEAFVENMPEAYLWADLVICRSGASSVAEVALYRKPALFIPLPIAHDHQLANAQKLLEAQACLLIEQKKLTSEKLKEIFEDFRQNPAKAQEFSDRLEPFRKPNSAQMIANQILSSILTK